MGVVCVSVVVSTIAIVVVRDDLPCMVTPQGSEDNEDDDGGSGDDDRSLSVMHRCGRVEPR